VLNSTAGGKAYLLPSFPPSLKKQYVRFPKSNFFKDSLFYKDFETECKALHKLFCDHGNNWEIRDERDALWQTMIDKVINKMWVIRSSEKGWSAHVRCQLPRHQKIWLDDKYQEERSEGDCAWLDEVARDFARFIIKVYEKVIGKSAKVLEDKDLI